MSNVYGLMLNIGCSIYRRPSISSLNWSITSSKLSFPSTNVISTDSLARSIYGSCRGSFGCLGINHFVTKSPKQAISVFIPPFPEATPQPTKPSLIAQAPHALAD